MIANHGGAYVEYEKDGKVSTERIVARVSQALDQAEQRTKKKMIKKLEKIKNDNNYIQVFDQYECEYGLNDAKSDGYHEAIDQAIKTIKNEN